MLKTSNFKVLNDNTRLYDMITEMYIQPEVSKS